MTRLRFVAAPPTPDGLLETAWSAAWVGIVVTADPHFRQSLGYLGEGRLRIRDEETALNRDPTPQDSMDFIATKLDGWWWVSRNELINVSETAVPIRHHIIEWLDEPSQRDRQMLAVPSEMVEVIGRIDEERAQ